jgi:hypothetical protein
VALVYPDGTQLDWASGRECPSSATVSADRRNLEATMRTPIPAVRLATSYDKRHPFLMSGLRLVAGVWLVFLSAVLLSIGDGLALCCYCPPRSSSS